MGLALLFREVRPNVSTEFGGRGYPDLHDHLANLERMGLLVKVNRPINKDTEMHPLVRWQFRGGIPEKDRRAFLFTNVTDSKGHKYDIPVVVGALAANREIYAAGIGCELSQIQQRWKEASANPIQPVVVENAPCQELVWVGDQLDQPGCGMDMIPVPISTPGWDNAPYTTLSMFITKDPETGIQNVGNYRGQVKGRRRLGMNPSLELRPGIYTHWLKYRERGQHMPAALVIGASPAVTFASVSKLPPDVDEVAVAGGLLGKPIRVVKCKTSEILVPAESEIVIEGYIDTEYLEPEGPFGESHGYINTREYNCVFHVTAITRRRNAILTSIISQVTPSESSLIKKVSFEPMALEHLKITLGVKSVTRVGMHEPLTNLRKLIVIQLKNPTEQEVWRALYGIASFQAAWGKLVVAVDEDIDPENADAIFWAMAYRMKPHRDVQILKYKDEGHGPRPHQTDWGKDLDSALLMNATRREKYPPISLPKREFMERAKQIWEELAPELGLPALKPQPPWYGYSLGEWSEEWTEEAERAVRGDYYQNGDRNWENRIKDDRINRSIGA